MAGANLTGLAAEVGESDDDFDPFRTVPTGSLNLPWATRAMDELLVDYAAKCPVQEGQ